jgi:hypothetical protein
MPDELNAQLDRLKGDQSDLILATAKYELVRADSALRPFAELENVIAVVEAFASKEAEWARNGSNFP